MKIIRSMFDKWIEAVSIGIFALMVDVYKRQSESSAEADGAEEGTFTVGFDQDFPPMGFVGDDGEYTGFDLELAQEVASRLGLKYVPQPIAWDAKDMEPVSYTHLLRGPCP